MSTLDEISFDSLLQRSNPFQGGDSCIDLTGYTFVAPAAMASLAAVIFRLSHNACRPLLLCPEPNVHGYLVRAGFFTVVDDVADVEPPVSTYAKNHAQLLEGSNPLVLELTRLENGRALPDRLDQIVSVLQHRFRYAKRDAFDAAIAISEICQNTFDHNQAACGFLTMQVYGRGTSRFLQIGVADYGNGIRESLARNPQHQALDDLAAIRRATELGSSEHDDPTRGTGLHHLLDIAYRQGGTVQIRSGGAKVRYNFKKRRGWGFTVPPVPGVHIALSLRARQKGS